MAGDGYSGSQGIWGWLWFSCGIWDNERGLVSVFWQVLAGHSFWQGDWALDYHSMGFRQFPDIS